MDQGDNEADEVNRLPLKALGLRPGMALQTRRLVEGASKKESQYFGAIEGKGVMVGPMGSDGDKTELEEGEVCIVRGFTGQYEYSFLSKVLQTFEKPFAYALLAYPARVDAKLVRQSMRTKTSWPTTASVVETNGSIGESQEVALVDISASGAMIKAGSALAAIGGTLALEMKVSVEDAPFTLRVQAGVCHSNRAKYEDAYFMGLAFKGLTQQDKLVLHYLTQSAMP
jgi:c-di-GMP-binding flagellar brake protein YcgR